MGKSVSLSPNERRVITQKLGDGLRPCHIAELLKQEIRTIKKAKENIIIPEKHVLMLENQK